MMTHPIRALLLLPALFGLLLPTSACESEPGSPEALTVELYVCAESQDPFADVDVMRVTVTGDDLDQDVVAETDYTPSGSLQVPFIPHAAASERQVIIEGYATIGETLVAVSRGASVPVKVDLEGDPASLNVLFSRINTFLPLTGDTGAKQELVAGRVGHTVTYTVRNEVVIAGGATVVDSGASWWSLEGVDSVQSGVEVVDESTLRVTKLDSGLVRNRVFHTATALPTGQIIVAGGYGSGGEARDTVEVYDPGADGGFSLFSEDIKLAKPRAHHTATLIDPDIDNLTMLFVGGDVDGQPTYELWTPYGYTSGALDLPDGELRKNHQATSFTIPVNDSQRPFVLISGGESDSAVLDSLWIFDVENEQPIVHPGKLPKGPRTQHSAVFVAHQQLIYLIGGFSDTARTQASAKIDVYQSAELDLSKSFREGVDDFNLHAPRGAQSAVLMPGDAILVAGGQTSAGDAMSSIEIIHEYLKPTQQGGSTVAVPVIKVSPSCTDGSCAIPPMIAPRVGHEMVVLDRGMVLLVGGLAGKAGDAVSLVRDLSLYNPQ